MNSFGGRRDVPALTGTAAIEYDSVDMGDDLPDEEMEQLVATRSSVHSPVKAADPEKQGKTGDETKA